MKYKNYIGVLDSGVGGLTVLKELTKILPNEKYIYYGDSLHSPYGNKTREQILQYTMEISDYLINNGVKAIVIACNTATSAAIKEIREKYQNIPIIGIEPAIKPAITNHPTEKIIVMATESTIKLDKFNELLDKYDNKNQIIPLSCNGLATAIENNVETKDLLKKFLLPYKNMVSIIVLGCTHYPFVKKEIKEILGDVIFYDGSYGTALNLKKQLELQNQLNSNNSTGEIVFVSSSNDVKKYKTFFDKL